MKKYKIHMLVAALIIVFALGTLLVQANDKSEAGSNDIILNILETAEVQDITSLSFSAKVEHVSDSARVSVVFNEDTLPENTIRKSTYKDGQLNVYIAGVEQLFKDGTQLNIGTVKVDNDTNGAKNVRLKLVDNSAEFINEFEQNILFPEGKVELVGKITEELPSESPSESESPEEPANVNKTTLEALLKEYNSLEKDGYTQASWQNFDAVRKEAEAVLADNAAGQKAVDDMTEKLKAAFTALVRIADSTEEAKNTLKDVLDNLNKLVSSEYTAESWNSLYSLMQQAQLMLDNDADKAEIEDMIGKLKAAQNALTKDEETSSKEDEKTTTKAPDKNTNTGTASPTGDESNVMLWVILGVAAIAGAGIVMVVTKKKEK